MNAQINLRMPDKLLDQARRHADRHGYSTVQDFIKETLRERLFEEHELSKKELALIRKFIAVGERKNIFGTEQEMFNKLKVRKR